MDNKLSKKKIIRLIIAGVIVIALLIVGIGYVAGWFDKGYAADVVTAQKRSITSTFDTSGTVSASDSGVFTAAEGVKVNSVYVKVGDRVKKGQAIASFDAANLNDNLSKRQADLEKALKAKNDYSASVSKAKSDLASLDRQIASQEKKVASLEKKAAQETADAKKVLTPQQAEQAQQKIEEATGDSTLAGRIIDNIVSSSKSLTALKEAIEAFSSMSSFDGSLSQMSSLMSAVPTGSSQYELIQAQLELASLKASRTASQTVSNGSLESAYDAVYAAALKNRDAAKATFDSLNNGWVAEHDGIVSAVNIKAGETIKSENTSSGSFDINSVLSAVSSGGDFSTLLSSFSQKQTSAIEIKYLPLEISFMINKGDLDKVYVGKAATVKSSTGALLPAEVSYVSAIASSSSAVDINSLLGSTGGSSAGIEARVTLNEADSGIIIGLDADVSIEVEKKTGCLTVPVESIQYDDSNAYVYSFDSDKKTISKKQVETGIFDGGYYEITSGLKEGEIIIRTPVATTKDGDKVIPRNVDKR